MIIRKIVGFSVQLRTEIKNCQIKSDWKLKDYFRYNINGLSHVLGVGIAFIFLVVLSFLSYGNVNKFAIALLYTFCAGCLFGASATMHLLTESLHVPKRLEEFLDRLDHSAIYLLIAGSYTPVILETISLPWKNYMLFIIWGLAIIGIISTQFRDIMPQWTRHKAFSITLYLSMGWIFLIRIQELVSALPPQALFFICAEAVFYTIGALIYATEKPDLKNPYFGFHQIWHLLVLLGFISHSVAVVLLYTR